MEEPKKAMPKDDSMEVADSGAEANQTNVMESPVALPCIGAIRALGTERCVFSGRRSWQRICRSGLSA